MRQLIFALPNGSVAVTTPAGHREGEPEAVWLDRVSRKCCPKGGKLVAVVNADELPTREHRDAWVWDGEKIVVDPSRIKPPAPALQPAPEGAAAAYDPRVGGLGQQLSQQIADTFSAMQQEFDQRVVVETRRQLEVLMVKDAVARDLPVQPGHFPALTRLLTDRGKPVSAETIVAAADEQDRRGRQIAAGMA